MKDLFIICNIYGGLTKPMLVNSTLNHALKQLKCHLSTFLTVADNVVINKKDEFLGNRFQFIKDIRRRAAAIPQAIKCGNRAKIAIHRTAPRSLNRCK